ncbi:hypothetical protein F4802DRAFT_312163 [Xylaria palmicola]|nr:hypothetical protein F4802DRAFT_312163 [Xylaria palmicola]
MRCVSSRLPGQPGSPRHGHCLHGASQPLKREGAGETRWQFSECLFFFFLLASRKIRHLRFLLSCPSSLSPGQNPKGSTRPPTYRFLIFCPEGKGGDQQRKKTDAEVARGTARPRPERAGLPTFFFLFPVVLVSRVTRPRPETVFPPTAFGLIFFSCHSQERKGEKSNPARVQLCALLPVPSRNVIRNDSLFFFRVPTPFGMWAGGLKDCLITLLPDR